MIQPLQVRPSVYINMYLTRDTVLSKKVETGSFYLPLMWITHHKMWTWGSEPPKKQPRQLSRWGGLVSVLGDMQDMKADCGLPVHEAQERSIASPQPSHARATRQLAFHRIAFTRNDLDSHLDLLP